MSDPTAPPPDPDEATLETPIEEKQRLLDRFRGTGVGVEDPNIVGDAGPSDVPPGADPDGPVDGV